MHDTRIPHPRIVISKTPYPRIVISSGSEKFFSFAIEKDM